MNMRKEQLGIGMIELLIALLVSLVALMGAAGLVVRTVQQEAESYQRLQALTLVQDMVDRINVNRQVVTCYSNGANGETLGTGVTFATDVQDCGGSDQQNRADADMLAWHNALLGASEKDADDDTINLGSMIGARGCIEQVDAANRLYRVTVAWQGLSETVTPTSDCGQGQYGAEPKRRAVSILIRLANLS
ncbi:type IV pilus assembly protein PilV [Litorivivens lipolytica]|uniref:Type IV pilus assembly protein PilV n=1 Tax=Litorivivens lipolytica TaxID=1524264 RepID=A0A7W4Z5V7_9GAMM|nr:type IV pilus modification protein PilV [Litorivivens lipolytica]MBB3047507.1 type IV pilus assembly protein PilV [Litorivivens lipolytica]